MNRLVLKIEDNNNYLNLLNLLKHLDFVQIEQQEEEEVKKADESLFGSLSEYANSEKCEDEKEAFLEMMKKKHEAY